MAARQFKRPSESRSRNMRAITSANNRTTERRIRAHLAQLGISDWHVRSRELPGWPDFLFPVAKIALFADGCFWHGCPRCGHTPKSNIGYWKRKLARNKARDRTVNRELRSRGFKVIRIWECEIKRNPRKCLLSLFRSLRRAACGVR